MAVQTNAKPVAVIGVSLDLGAGRRGVDMGPSAIRYAGLSQRLGRLGLPVEDWGNVEGAVAEASDVGSERVRFLPQIKAVCERVAELVAEALERDLFPLVLGGDHSLALGTLGGLAKQNGHGGVLWIDAHGDLNRPETSPTGNVHGMPLAAALGLAGPEFESEAWTLPAVDADRIALVGVRSLDPAEAELAMELVAESGLLGSMDVVEVNPILDRANETAKLAVELVASALGARIL